MVRLPSCPICKCNLSATAATESRDFPFCSERCRNVDLLRWSDGKYAIVEPLSADMIAQQQSGDELDEECDGDGY
ncbi:MAG: DNA gyrase inhibitor YacG [Planctomycetota bacterium]|nr:DNA gyrase inhibitor YacG [Planctomycetota bacterium]